MVSSAAKRPRPQEEKLDAIFQALADPTRRALLARLLKKPAMVTELAEPFAMSLPAVSRHLRVLQDAGLIVREVKGRVHRCSLESKPLAEVEAWLQRYRPFGEGKPDAPAASAAGEKA